MDIIHVSIGVIIGGLITFFVSFCFYKKAAEDLKKESNLLRNETAEVRKALSVLMTFISNNQGLFDLTSELVKKEDGNFGVNVTIRVG